MKLSKSQIKKLDKLSKKKPIMVRVGHNWYTWYESDGNIVWLTTQGGDEKEFKYKEIDDIQEGITKMTKSQLREIIREEIREAVNSDLRSEFERSGEYRKSEKILDRLESKIEKLFFDFVKKQGFDKNDSTIRNSAEYVISGLFGRGI
jgi:hypothetical protein